MPTAPLKVEGAVPELMSAPVGERHNAGFDRIGGGGLPHDKNSRKDVEALFEKAAGLVSEIGGDEGAVDLLEGLGELLAVASSQFGSSDQADGLAFRTTISVRLILISRCLVA